jgi:hypothetical protein
VALLDFEFTARRPAGYDHAKLHVFLADNPAARAAVQYDLATTLPAQAGFWLAVVLVACREITSHRRHPGLLDRERRLTQLGADLAEAIDRVRRLPRQYTPPREARCSSR